MKPRFPLIAILALLLFFCTLSVVWQTVEKQSFVMLNRTIGGLLLIFLWVCGLDYFISRKRKLLKIKRILPKNIILGKETPIRLQITAIHSAIRHPIPLVVGDCLPPDWTTDTPEIHTELLPMSRYGVEVTYNALPHRRGETRFAGIDYALPSRLGLWQMIFRQPENNDTPIKVLPDFADIYGA
ncbi:MAG: hypothetical protein IJM09_05930, partial [Neisseriaceae bacterium]|nr:hypothetical protein [Neisseriaceae bacterium]